MTITPDPSLVRKTALLAVHERPDGEVWVSYQDLQGLGVASSDQQQVDVFDRQIIAQVNKVAARFQAGLSRSIRDVAVRVGIETVVLSVNPADRRISLGMKQLLDNPWENLTDKYPAGTIVEGRVRNLTDFGAFIEIEDGIDGLVHVSNLSWTKRVKHPSEIVKKGEKVKAVVLGVEPQNRRLSLGIKQLQPDVWESFFATHRVGDQVHGKVLRTAQFGAFVEIAEGVEGLCHISEAGDEGGGPSKLETGLEHEFKIIKINVEEKKVGLSLRAVNGQEASRAQVESYKKESHKQPVSSSTTTLGDLINWKSEKSE